MGGTSYAAIKLPANSVGTKQIKANAVVASKIKDGTLTAKDFAPGQAPKGIQGPQGAWGTRTSGACRAHWSSRTGGTPSRDIPRRSEQWSPLLPGGSVLCPPGEIATGGGGNSATGTIRDSGPQQDGNGFPID
jgi:hypothetical protein